MDWDNAQEYAELRRLGGYEDWRVPNIHELFGIVDLSRFNPATEMPNTFAERYWSSSTSAYYTYYAWNVNFYSGLVYSYNKTFTSCVRCVRTSNAIPRGNQTATRGWICPVCGNGFAPWILRCPCVGRKKNCQSTRYNMED